ncbi:MAG: type transport system permease protein [Actinoplanes sp.]|jgi:ABC-2 type transport system permease protein|nr:type transport system permease protein [Actinoplanes sp.]
MALTFIRLKLRVSANGLRGQTSRVVLLVLGAMLATGLAVGGWAGFAVPGLLGEPAAARAVLALGGGLLVLGWLFLPLVFFGVDESLDPARFALLPLTRRTLITGLFAAALVGIPAVATLVATFGMVDTVRRLGGLGAAVVELVGVILGLLLCTAVSRSVTSAFATALRSRRARDLGTILLAAVAALLGPLQIAVAAGAQHADWGRVAAVADVVAWTPLGAAYTMGLDLADGRAWAVPVKLVIVLATIGVLLWWWSSTVERAMVGATAAARRQSADDGLPVSRLLFRWLPRSRFGALVAREMRYWWRETRRRASLITFSVVGIFLPVMLSVSGSGPGPMLLFVGALAAVSLANQFGFEGSAYAANLTAGVPGRTEIRSRATGYSVYAIPLLIVIAVVVSVVAGTPGRIPSTLGELAATYGVGLSIVLPVSVRAAYALPDTTNPFAMSSGGGMAKGLLTFGALFGSIILTLPLLVVAYLIGDTWLWIGLPAGLLYGGVAYLIGSRLAGTMLDARMPEVLAAVTQRR